MRMILERSSGTSGKGEGKKYLALVGNVGTVEYK